MDMSRSLAFLRRMTSSAVRTPKPPFKGGMRSLAFFLGTFPGTETIGLYLRTLGGPGESARFLHLWWWFPKDFRLP